MRTGAGVGGAPALADPGHRVSALLLLALDDPAAGTIDVGFHGQLEIAPGISLMGRRVYVAALGRFTRLDAAVTLRIYPRVGHDIVADQIRWLSEVVAALA